MNSVKRQFGIILKLAVMLCLIGCFFIGKTSVVKATLTVEKTGSKLTLKTDDGDTDGGRYNVILQTGSSNSVCTIDLPTGTGSKSATGTLNPDTVLRVAAKEGLYADDVEYIVSKVGGGETPTGYFTDPIYTVTTTVDSTGSATINPIAGTYIDSSNIVYGYAGGKLSLEAGGFSTGKMFDYWEMSTATAPKKSTKSFTYEIYGIDATAYAIEWVLFAKDAATDISLDSTYHDGDVITMSPGTKTYTVAIDEPSFDIGNITWNVNNSKIAISTTIDDHLRITWPSDLYGSYVLTATLPDATDEGALVTAYSLERIAVITDVKITGPSKAYVGVPAKYTVSSISPAGAVIPDPEWYRGTTDTGISDTTYTFTPTTAGTYTFTLKYDSDSKSSNTITTVVDATPAVSEIKINPDGVTVGYTATVTATVTPAAAASLFLNDATGRIESSDSEYFTIDKKSVDATTGKITLNIKGLKHETDKKLKFTYTGGSKDFTFKVYMKPKLEESSGSLKITLPDKVITGCSNDLTEVTGFRLYAYKSDIDSPIYDSGDTYKSAGKSKTLSASDVNQIVKDKSGSFSGEQDTLKFVVVPMGKRSGSDDYHRAKTSDDKVIKSDEVSVNVYRASVSGNGIIGSSAYGIAGQKVSITASPAAGYASIKWSDGSTNPTKEVTLSTSTSANQLKAEGVLGAQNPNAAGGTGGANSGDMSGYDDVPKTAESNSAIWLIVFMVFAVLGIAYALYLQLRASTSNDK